MGRSWGHLLLFPSDEITRSFLKEQGREEQWRPLSPEPGAVYHEEVTVDLSRLEPLIACPHSPDRVKTVAALESLPVDQVAIGSCTNSSYQDLFLVSKILAGKTIHPGVNLVVSPGSRQVLWQLAEAGVLAGLIASGARLLEAACGPCIGMGQAPPSGGVSLRTFNRNFAGRSGTADASIYLCGTATAAATALKGVLTDPRKLGPPPELPPLPIYGQGPDANSSAT